MGTRWTCGCAVRKKKKTEEGKKQKLLGGPQEGAVGLFEPHGCGKCAHIGYRGRLPLFEFKQVGAALREAILHTPDIDSLVVAANSTDPEGLLDDGLAKVRAGATSLEEVLRVVS